MNKALANDTILKVKIEHKRQVYNNKCSCESFTFATYSNFLYKDKLNIFKISKENINNLDIIVLGGNLIKIYKEREYFLVYPKEEQTIIIFKSKKTGSFLCSKIFSNKYIFIKLGFSIMSNYQEINQKDSFNLFPNQELYVNKGDSILKRQLPSCEYQVTGKITITLIRDTVKIVEKWCRLDKKINLSKIYKKALQGDRIVIDINFDNRVNCWNDTTYYEDVIISVPIKKLFLPACYP